MAGILVTGATGRVGGHLVRLLRRAGAEVRPAMMRPEGRDAVRFSFTDPSTYGDAFQGVERVFLMRPPQLGNVSRDMLPALEAARRMGVRHMVLLSLQGAEKNPFVPHRALERWLAGSGMDWTFVRSGFFMQNLSTTHAAEIRDEGVIMVPAGRGRTSFVDVRDVAEVAALALREDGHAGQAYTPTGAEALSYADAAGVISAVLGRTVRYAAPGPVAYWRHARRHGMDVPMAAVTLALYSMCRLGLAAGVTDDVRRLLGRAPIAFEQFVKDERAAWE
ncbi:SDR family oxidoreductase [Actinomadura sp. ATCC 31491]|uniref:SDR family oxidoreductase n=1 Tax=Actinomadura luzonensis TaxID=2805427 RepID=A0ABT0G752_9ACTN|nr:SDR family oxidoreductase [Actinomadura luzonensis]MCK2220430.1 SDR family oxidoreductase [Actinomadura luzonensis]